MSIESDLSRGIEAPAERFDTDTEGDVDVQGRPRFTVQENRLPPDHHVGDAGRRQPVR
jgi:hypothetical protein